MSTTHARFCTHCGTALPDVAARGPQCARCNNINSTGARVLVACCIVQDDRLAWMRRAQQPRRGFWSIPGGFLESGESLKQAAVREVFEEVGLQIPETQLRLYGVGSVKHMNEVYVVYRTTVGQVTLRPGPEALDVRFFSESEFPWDEMAFPTVRYSAHMTYEDIRRGRYGLYLADPDRGLRVEQS